MRGALTGSLLAHGLALAAVMIVRAPMPVVIPGPESVQVSLLDASAMAAMTATAPTAPAPAPEDEGVKLDEPKPAPDTKPEREPDRRPERPRDDTPPSRKPAPPNAAMTSLPMATIGGPGMRGSVSVDARDFEFAYYLRLVRDQIARNWSPPAGLGAGGKPVQAVVYFRIARGGQLSAVKVEESSGIDFFDQSVARAVRISDPLPPLPLGFPAGDLGVHFGFEYTGS